MNPDQPILVLSRKKPHLVFVLLLTIASGLSIFTGESQGGEDVDPDLAAEWVLVNISWAYFLLFTGGVALLAHLQRWDRERGMYVERGALTMQAGGVLSYGVCLPVFLGWPPEVIISLPVAAAWVWANLWEVKLIGADLKLISAARRFTPRGSDDPVTS